MEKAGSAPKIRTIKRLNKKGKLSRKAIRDAVTKVVEEREARESANGAPAKRPWWEEEETLQ